MFADLIGKTVIHQKWGEGKVLKLEGTLLQVKFASFPEPKKFQYPTCFEKFLRLKDGSSPEIQKDMDQYAAQQKFNTEKETIRKKIEIVNEKRHQKAARHHSRAVPRFNDVASFCDSYIAQTRGEAYYVKTTGGKRQQIYDGKLVEKVREGYVYTFTTDTELNYPSWTNINLWRLTDSYKGQIIDCSEFTIIIVSKENFGNEVKELEFSAEPWVLLNALNERLTMLRDRPTPIVRRLITEGFQQIEKDEMLTGQDTAVYMSMHQPITFVWGPPGTGKTQVLARIALEHVRNGERVLMVSYSNVSVDGAIERTFHLDEEPKEGKLIRYGYAKSEMLKQHPYLTSYHYVLNSHIDLLKKQNDLMRERKKTDRRSEEYVKLSQEITSIRNRMRSEEREVVRNARFVATTVSKASIDKAIYESDFDTVIFDEASMAYVPQVILAAGLARKHFVCMGDFNQLPPIVQNQNSRDLSIDIFKYCGIEEAVSKKMSHRWLCMLDVQYRMHPDIAGFVSHYMYHGLLQTDEEVTKERKKALTYLPNALSAVELVDLTGMLSVSLSSADNSHFNVLSAFIDCILAVDAARQSDVGIITPYHAQAKLLNSMGRDIEAAEDESQKSIVAATVHQFQGSEEPIIIYDAVDCYRQKFPGALLTSAENDQADRLFNVAMTRSKIQFIAVANVEFMQKKKLPDWLLFYQLMRQCRQKRDYFTGENFINHAFAGSEVLQILSTREGNAWFLDDITNARRRIRIDIPEPVRLDRSFLLQLSDMLRTAKKRGVEVIVRTEKKDALPQDLRSLSIESYNAVNPIVIIDERIIWFNEPVSELAFKTEDKASPIQFRPVIRFIGRNTAKTLYGYLRMGRTIDQYQGKVDSTDTSDIEVDRRSKKASSDTFAAYVASHVRCKMCGNPMRLVKSKKGKFFLGCTDRTCGQTEMVKLDLIEDYLSSCGKYGLLCERCGTSLEAALGQYGVYVRCNGEPRHTYSLDKI